MPFLPILVHYPDTGNSHCLSDCPEPALMGDVGGGVGMAAYGFVVIGMDNIAVSTAKVLADIHPLITIFGV